MLIYTESLFKYSSVNPDRQQYAYRDNPLYIYIFQKTCFTAAAKYNQSHHPEGDE